MSLFPRFTQEFAPIFRLFDEYDRQAFSGLDRQLQSVRSFTPKFDVSETKEAYELHGELPGIDQKNINVEWTDNNTLTISGRHEHVREEGQRPQALESSDATLAEQKKIEAHQPTVEDETPQSSTTTPSATSKPLDSEATDAQVAKTQSNNQVTKDQTPPQAKYWVSERSVGEFHRSFAFPARVEQDAVKASLRNGILSIVVPKATAPVSRKISIQ